MSSIWGPHCIWLKSNINFSNCAFVIFFSSIISLVVFFKLCKDAHGGLDEPGLLANLHLDGHISTGSKWLSSLNHIRCHRTQKLNTGKLQIWETAMGPSLAAGEGLFCKSEQSDVDRLQHMVTKAPLLLLFQHFNRQTMWPKDMWSLLL